MPKPTYGETDIWALALYVFLLRVSSAAVAIFAIVRTARVVSSHYERELQALAFGVMERPRHKNKYLLSWQLDPRGKISALVIAMRVECC